MRHPFIQALGLAAALGLTACGPLPTSTPPALQTGGAPPESAVDPFAAGLIPAEQAALDQTQTHYTIDLHLADDLLRLAGSEQAIYTNQETVALDSLVFRLFPNLIGGECSVSSVRIGDQPADFALEPEGSVLRLPLLPALQPGEQTTVTLEFGVVVPEDSTAGYGLLGLSKGILSLSHIYPMIPVYDDEGWNVEVPPEYADLVYADVATFEVTVDAPAGLVFAASGLQISQTVEGQRQVVTFAAGPARDFQLAASRDFERRTAAVGDTRLVSYAAPEFRPASERLLQYAASAVAFFDGLLGPYPYTELDFVSVPIEALGVEYPGIISIDLSFYDPQDEAYPESWFESVIAHEAAHQWFYGVVGNDQQDDPWLDESLAQYLTLRYFADRYGPEGAQGYRQSLYDRWDRVERALIPIGLPVRGYTPLEYGAIVYGRGGLFFEALAEALGQPAADEFLRDAYQSQRWGIASPESLQALAEAHCSCDLDSLFHDWVSPDG